MSIYPGPVFTSNEPSLNAKKKTACWLFDFLNHQTQKTTTQMSRYSLIWNNELNFTNIYALIVKAQTWIKSRMFDMVGGCRFFHLIGDYRKISNFGGATPSSAKRHFEGQCFICRKIGDFCTFKNCNNTWLWGNLPSLKQPSTLVYKKINYPRRFRKMFHVIFLEK